MCSANVLVEEYILEMVHWYGSFKFSVKMSRDDVHVSISRSKFLHCDLRDTMNDIDMLSWFSGGWSMDESTASGGLSL